MWKRLERTEKNRSRAEEKGMSADVVVVQKKGAHAAPNICPKTIF